MLAVKKVVVRIQRASSIISRMAHQQSQRTTREECFRALHYFSGHPGNRAARNHLDIPFRPCKRRLTTHPESSKCFRR